MCPSVRDVGLQHGDSWKNLQRRIYDHEFLYCFTGNAHINLSGRDYDISPGTLVLIPPDTSHSFWVDEKFPGELYWIHFDYFYREDPQNIFDLYNKMEEYVNLFLNRPLEPSLVREQPVFEGGYVFPEYLKVEQPDAVEFIIRQIYQSFTRKDANWELRCKILLLELLELILKQTTKEDVYYSSSHRVMVEQMKSFVRSNYCKKIHPGEVAAVTGMSVDYASRIFHKIAGMRLVEYIIRLRLSKAKALMLEPDLKLEDIAHMVGLENKNYFCRLIRKYEGLSPSDLRLKLRRSLLHDDNHL
jgi:YesN/AraC family two-component response regulator